MPKTAHGVLGRARCARTALRRFFEVDAEFVALANKLAKKHGDRFKPNAGDESAAGASHPYLGAGFEFLPKRGATGAEYLRNIHCFNLAAALSFGSIAMR